MRVAATNFARKSCKPQIFALETTGIATGDARGTRSKSLETSVSSKNTYQRELLLQSLQNSKRKELSFRETQGKVEKIQENDVIVEKIQGNDEIVEKNVEKTQRNDEIVGKTQGNDEIVEKLQGNDEKTQGNDEKTQGNDEKTQENIQDMGIQSVFLLSFLDFY